MEGWFTEKGVMWPGISQSLEIEKKLHEEDSKYQHIVVYETKTFGRMMTLDGVIQLTLRDEFAYHEMMAHVSCCSHSAEGPKRALVIGGGDGGVVRELVKHASLECIDLCDIDERVTAVSKEYFPTISCGLSDPRVHCYFEDGVVFVERVAQSADQSKKYDIIITDSSDPVGPAEVLYQKAYYTSLRGALRAGGVVCSQAESMWLHGKVITDLVATCKEAGFGAIEYSTIMIPTYPCGSIGALMCRIGSNESCKQPIRSLPKEVESGLRYYNQDMHRASFALPAFLKKQIHS